MIGHRLTWGIPIETGGWQVVANSLPSLGAEELNALMSMTNVGTVDERGFTDGYGYFGEFHADGAAWAVFAHLYRSRKPVFTGRHFVQRDVCLAPVSEFRAMNNDAQPFFEVVPEPRVFGTVETATARWDAEPRAQPSEPRLARLESLPKEFLRDVLLAFLQPHPTIIVWQSPDASLLTSLLLLFPKVVRQRLTFCTAVGDVGAAQVRIKCIPAFKPDPTSAIVDFDRKLFRQPLVAVESMLPAQLVSAWQSGRLAELHAYLDDAVQWPGEQPFTRWLDDALAQWLSKNELLRGIDGTDRWDVARNHVQVMASAPLAYRSADRLFVAEHLVKNFDPENESDRLAGFIRELDPDGPELTRIETAAGERLAQTHGEPMKALAHALASILPLDNLAIETFRRLPPDRRHLEHLGDLEGVFMRRGAALPPAVIDDVLREWTFHRAPKTAEIRALLARVTSRDRLAALERNAPLLASLTSVPHGQIALELVRMQFGSGNERALLDLTERYADAAADVIAAKDDVASELAVQLIARIAAASRDRKYATAKNDVLVSKFVDHLERSANAQLLSDERVTFAMGWASRTGELRRRIEVVRSRFEGLAAEQALEDLLLAPTIAWAKGSPGAARQLLSVLSGETRWGWYVASELHADAEFRLAEFCADLRNEGRDAIPLLRMIATLVLHSSDRPRADAVDVLSCCVQAIAEDTPADSELRRRLATSWTPSGQKEFARVLALLSAYTTKSDHEPQRRQALPLMRLEEQLLSIASRLENFSVAIRDVAHWPELERLAVLSEEKEEIDFGRIENALKRVLEALDESALERVLKDYAARLRARKKGGGWLLR